MKPKLDIERRSAVRLLSVSRPVYNGELLARFAGRFRGKNTS